LYGPTLTTPIPVSRRRSTGLGSRHSRPRSGFTLIELLVSIAVIGILIALIVPAVQAARESARKSQCKNNLKQLSLAALNFEAAHNRLPSGGWGFQWQGFSDVSGLSGQPGSWTFSLLPFLEQQALYELGEYNSPPDRLDEELRQRIRTPLAVYLCPSRRREQLFGIDPACPSCGQPIGLKTPVEGVARCDYAVNIGDGEPDPTELDSWPLNFWGPADVAEAEQLTLKNKWPEPPKDWSGVSWLRKGVPLAAISDGTSNTILFGEKYVSLDAYESGTDWGDNEPLFGGFNNDNHRSTHPHWPYMADQREVLSIGSFGSVHANAGHFALCDGSVKAVSYTVDSTVYRYLGNRKDGEMVEVP
jgi:prepilin-type N-terminal cleavage/methylation domain-containing protein